MPVSQHLLSSFDDFYEVLHATTIPDEGGRVVPDDLGAITLSRAVGHLHNAMGREFFSSVLPLLTPIPASRSPLRIEGAASPEGPYHTVPGQEARSWGPNERDERVSPTLLLAFQRAMSVTAFSAERWNRLQPTAPGGDHQRYFAGDRLSTNEIELLATVGRLLRLEAKRPSQGSQEKPGIAGGSLTANIVAIHPDSQPDPPGGGTDQASQVASQPRRPPHAASDSPFIFRRDGAIWTLSYDSRVIQVPHRGASGLQYIQQLLMQPFKRIAVRDLEKAILHDSRLQADDGLFEEEIDQEALEKYRKRYEALEADKEKALAAEDALVLQECEKELQALAAEIDRVVDPSGRLKRINKIRRKLANKVDMAIRRSREQIGQEDEDFATHLRSSISAGTTLTYVSDPLPPWSF